MRIGLTRPAVGISALCVMSAAGVADRSARACEERVQHYDGSFVVVMLEGAVDPKKDSFGRMDKVGNACTIAATIIHADGGACEAVQNVCREREDTGIVRVGDPWRSGEYIDVTCPKFAALACGDFASVQGLTDACRVSLTGESVPDPFFLTPASFLCGLVLTGALAGASISTSHAHPEEAAAHSEAMTLLGAGVSVVGAIGCAAIPF